MTEAMATTESTADLIVYRDPVAVLDEARKAAQALKAVIDAKPKKVIFNGETYLEFEDWQTVGRFYGITPRVVHTKPVEEEHASGWEAYAEAVHIPTGRVIASADAMCLTDEEHWKERPKYEWHYVKKSGGVSADDPGKDELIWERSRDGKNRPKKVKVLVGMEAVPAYQRRSMAQTRACAKALRNALAWVVVLAGYKPTPAEELPHQGNGEEASALEPTAEELFPTVSEEREILVGKIRGACDKKKLAPERRKAIWQEFAKGASEETVDVAILHEILKYVHAL